MKKPFPGPSRNPGSVLGRNASLLSSGSVAKGLSLAEALVGIQGVLESLLIGEQKNPYLIAPQWRFLSISAGLL